MVYHGRMVMFWYIECISHGGEKHGVLHISWGRKAHLVWKFPDVCPEVVADVIAEPDVMLSGEDHVESRHFRTWSYDKIALRVIGTDIDTDADFIERERLLSVVLVVLMQLLNSSNRRPGVRHSTFESLRLGLSSQSIASGFLRFWDSLNFKKDREFVGITVLFLDEKIP
ncbi:hypothetical protein F2Q68_00043998 [Brassica cretica]|uniref:Uncharacterized protein n=1 Tax=Brassica cretica TaxID=69181 RepID=A0A8S9LL08_BRACR|nr:hypothetical protein F2Q68_00043998 [Brassica cretica]